MESWLFWILQLIPVGLILYFYVRQKYSYWAKLGIDGPKPSLLSIGNVLQIYGGNPSRIELDLAEKYGKVYGNYTLLDPTLTIMDAELIKQVLVKDFPSFVNRRKLKAYHELMNKNQFFTESAHWKRVRTITGPTFTSGKLRGMHLLMEKSVDKLIDYLDKLIKKENGLMNTKEVIAGFTIDVIASTSFGTETNSNEYRSGQNTFVEQGLDLFEVFPLRALSFFGMPRWFNDLVKVQHNLNVKGFKFFADLSAEILRQRKSGGSKKRNDLVQLLIDSYAYDSELNDGNYNKLVADMDVDDAKPDAKQISSGVKTKLTDNEIIAQCILFFIAGFETTAVSITNVMFELARNVDVQDRLCEELNQALERVDESTQSDKYYDIIMNQSPYLEAVIKETLRKYPPVLRLERRLTVGEYKIGGIPLYRDQLVEIPVYAVHHNPEYYPHPEKFNPDRFMPENKHLLTPYTYLPFGAGPRNCIGMRFAYQEIRLCIAKLVREFSFRPSGKTPDKLKFRSFKPTLNVEPFQVKVEKRF